MSQESIVIDHVLSTVRGIWSQIAGQTDRSPRNAIINHGLTHLVQEVMRETPSPEPVCLKILKEEGVCESIRNFCQDCEYEMECYWAHKIISSAHNQ